MTDYTSVAGTAGDEAEGLEDVWAAWADDAEPEPVPATDAAPTAADEWDDLRQVLAGEDEPARTDDTADADDDTDDDTDDDEPMAGDAADGAVHETQVALAARVDELTELLHAERAERERLAAQLDVLASELDAVLGEALAEEREQRRAIEESLRQVQAMLAEPAAPDYDGPERRGGTDRRAAGERRRTGARRERPLRARDFTPEPDDVDEQHHDDELAEPTPSAWKSRLHDVAGSVSAWSSDDIDRLRVD